MYGFFEIQKERLGLFGPIIATVLTLAGLPNHLVYSQQEKIQEPGHSVSLDQWLDSYASPTPFSNWNKLANWPLTAEQLNKIIEREKTTLTFDKPFLHNGTPTRTLSTSRTDRERLTPRDLWMLREVHRIISLHRLREADAPRRLQVIIWGRNHSFDYFLSTLDKDISYAGQPFGKNKVLLGSPEYTEFRDLLGKDYINIIGRLKPMDIYLSSEGAASGLIKSLLGNFQFFLSIGKKYIATDLLSEKPARSDIILFSWLHSLDECAPMLSFPREIELGAAGISTIDVYLEGLSKEPKGLTLEAARKRFDFRENVIRANRMERVRERSVQAFDLLETGKVQDSPEIISFLERLGRLKANGFAVTINGLEPPTH